MDERQALPGLHHSQRPIEVVRLGGDAELGVEWAVGFAVAEEVDSECRAVRLRERRPDVPPEETARAEAVYQQDGRATVAISFDVHGAWADGDS